MTLVALRDDGLELPFALAGLTSREAELLVSFPSEFVGGDDVFRLTGFEPFNGLVLVLCRALQCRDLLLEGGGRSVGGIGAGLEGVDLDLKRRLLLLQSGASGGGSGELLANAFERLLEFVDVDCEKGERDRSVWDNSRGAVERGESGSSVEMQEEGAGRKGGSRKRMKKKRETHPSSPPIPPSPHATSD